MLRPYRTRADEDARRRKVLKHDSLKILHLFRKKSHKTPTLPTFHIYSASPRKRYAKKHLRVSRQRKGFGSKEALRVIKSNDFIAYEDLRLF